MVLDMLYCCVTHASSRWLLLVIDQVKNKTARALKQTTRADVDMYQELIAYVLL
jgi:hypothetical protein